jgi:hypothetical protein
VGIRVAQAFLDTLKAAAILLQPDAFSGCRVTGLTMLIAEHLGSVWAGITLEDAAEIYGANDVLAYS